jgi:sporulation protein YlmC with PRC-barrel domain
MEFTIGNDVNCSDGACGEVARVVLDPIARAVTHLVVTPKHRRRGGRLVPLALVEVATDEIRIRCTMKEFTRFDRAEATRWSPRSMAHAPSGAGRPLPYTTYALTKSVGGGDGFFHASRPIGYETVPYGEVDVRRGEHVHTTDGRIGRLQGLAIDVRDHCVTRVLLREGHLWGRKKVAIPSSAIIGVDDGIWLRITKKQVRDLPRLSAAT